MLAADEHSMHDMLMSGIDDTKQALEKYLPLASWPEANSKPSRPVQCTTSGKGRDTCLSERASDSQKEPCFAAIAGRPMAVPVITGSRGTQVKAA